MTQGRNRSRRTQEVPRFSRAARNARAARRGPAWAQPAEDSRPWWMPRRDAPAQPAPAVPQQPARRRRAAPVQATQFPAAYQPQFQPQPGMQPVPAQVIQLGTPRPAFRFRKHTQPFIWLALLLAAGTLLHRVPHPGLVGILAGLLIPAVMWFAVLQRQQDKTFYFRPWTRRFVHAQALVTSAWLMLMATAGPLPCAPWVLLSSLPFMGLWMRRYRWRPKPAEKAAPVEPAADAVTFAALAAARGWQARLGERTELPNGGRKYPVQCDGIKTTMDEVLAAPHKVAGAWHKPMTEAYAERDPLGVTSRGSLTILSANSLSAGRFWDQQGMDLETGTVRTGRFADGEDARDKWYEERYGCYHELDSGTTGSGKTARLDLAVFIALMTGWFVPVILDPQEGQSLPFWRERCIFASGEGQVSRRIRGLHAAFMDRSSFLGTLRWTDYTDAGPIEMPGMPFFDYQLLMKMGLRMPIVMPILDEAHTVLKSGNKEQRLITSNVVEMARLIRKAGGRMVLATQLPGLTDLGGSQALRDMLRGGTVWSGRTANRVSGGMLGLAKDPSEIPRFFPGGAKTSGLGYTDSWNARPDAPMRTDLPPAAAYASPPPVPALDDRFMEVMEAAMRESVSPTSTEAPVQGDKPKGGALLKLVRRELPPAEPDDAAPEGRRCIDAVLAVLQTAGEPLDRGQVAARVAVLSAEWERPKCWTLRQIGNTLRELTEAGRITQPGGKGTGYQIADN